MPQEKRRWQLVRVGVFVAIVAALLVAASQQTYAQQSEIKQEILAPDCSARSCDIGSPTIGSIDKNSGRPIATGTYDVTYTKNLVVTFGGIVYTLGSSSELTAERGEWRLDLSSLSSPLAPGKYELVIEAIGYDGQKSEARAAIELLPSDIKNDGLEPEGNSDGSPVPKPTVFMQPSLTPLRIVLMLTIVTLGLYRLVKRRGKNRKEAHDHDIIHSNDV